MHVQGLLGNGLHDAVQTKIEEYGNSGRDMWFGAPES